MSEGTGRRVAQPIVFPSYAFRRTLYHILSLTLPKRMPALPDWLKYVLATLILVNIRSFPLLWHIRVFYSAIAARERARPSVHPLLFWIKSNKVITTSPGVTPRLRLDCIPIGRDIFTDADVCRFRATPDDCDYNLHLSNSSYAKNLDYNRISFLASRFLRAHFDGSHFALGGTQYIFHAELPMLAKYEIETKIGAWDDKWLYVIGRFWSASDRKHSNEEPLRPNKLSRSAQNLKALLADVTKPNAEAGAASARAVKKQQEEEPARKLYCTTISRYCFKAGRKSIPPWFAIATSGYGTYASTRTNWDKAESLRRKIQTQKMAEHFETKGRPMPRDNVVLGSAYRKAGIFAAYDPARPENAEDDERGLGAWQDRKNWQVGEWEERRTKRLAAIASLGGVVSSKPALKADILDD